MRHFFGIWCLCCLLACEGTIGDDGALDGGPGRDGAIDAPDAWLPPAECGSAGEALVYFATTCASSGACHQPGGRFPDLSPTGIARLVDLDSERLPGERLVVSGDPEGSWLYRKMAGLQGEDGGGLMPAGRRSDWDELPDDVAFVRDWILEGAPAECDSLPPIDLPRDPNTLDRDALFQCDDPSAPRSSPARYRRIERLQFTHTMGRRRDGLYSSVFDNPLVAPVRHPYSTYSEGVTLDSATLNVWMLSFGEAAELFTREDSRLQSSLLNGAAVSCIYEATPDDACIDRFVDVLLTNGVLHRTPTDYERSHLRELLVRTLDGEADLAARTRTVRTVSQAAMLTAGGVFRTEEPTSRDDDQMSGEALALALSQLLSTRPVGSIKTTAFANLDADVDRDRVEDGWFALLADAAAIPEGMPGSIHDPEVRRELVLRYAGGVDPERSFWDRDEARLLALGNAPGPGRLGEFWITGVFVHFFREWLDYIDADTIFKDDPSATSRYESFDVINGSFASLQGGGSREGRLSHQLDDWIARLVVETHEDSTRDFWGELMTGRLWHVPATGVGPPCTTTADCTMTYAGCSRFNDCRNTSGTVRRDHTQLPLLFSVEQQVLGTQAARWVEVPEEERRGVLTHPTWLAAHGLNFEDDASLVERGKWVREQIFCETVGQLQFVEVEAQLIPSQPDLPARERVRLSTEQDNRCIACHDRMNPLGNLFELYNHAGYFREDDHGQAPDGSTVLTNLPLGAGEDLNGTYASPFEFVEALADSRLARRGWIRHAFRYFMGRDETMADQCTLAEMEAAYEARGSFVDMVAALAATDTFARRATEGARP
ncbi:MAG: hypothetical protein ACI9KE_002783 [Polyangiales bacterium]|jgi:hypothetical protein